MLLLDSIRNVIYFHTIYDCNHDSPSPYFNTNCRGVDIATLQTSVSNWNDTNRSYKIIQNMIRGISSQLLYCWSSLLWQPFMQKWGTHGSNETCTAIGQISQWCADSIISFSIVGTEAVCIMIKETENWQKWLYFICHVYDMALSQIPKSFSGFIAIAAERNKIHK